MSPHDSLERSNDLTPIDTIAKINKDKLKYFKEQCFILGNIGCNSKELVRSESINGNRFIVQTGFKSFITVFHIDDCDAIDNLMELDIDFDDCINYCIRLKNPRTSPEPDAYS